jgi:hypothetical protein
MDALDDRTLAAYIDATALLLHLPVAPEHLPGVQQNFARIAALAQLVIDVPLDMHDEPAPVFHPGRPV